MSHDTSFNSGCLQAPKTHFMSPDNSEHAVSCGMVGELPKELVKNLAGLVPSERRLRPDIDPKASQQTFASSSCVNNLSGFVPSGCPPASDIDSMEQFIQILCILTRFQIFFCKFTSKKCLC